MVKTVINLSNLDLLNILRDLDAGSGQVRRDVIAVFGIDLNKSVNWKMKDAQMSMIFVSHPPSELWNVLKRNSDECTAMMKRVMREHIPADPAVAVTTRTR